MLNGMTSSEMTFEIFYNEFLRSKSNPSDFNIKRVNNFSTFWVQFKELQCGTSRFNYDNINDFVSFYKEFTGSDSGSDDFSVCYALKNQ